MMVIQGVISGISPATKIIPAENCTWEEVSVAGGYRIDNVEFYDGSRTNQVAAAGGQVIPVPRQIVNPILGYVGKSGRFVAMSNPV